MPAYHDIIWMEIWRGKVVFSIIGRAGSKTPLPDSQSKFVSSIQGMKSCYVGVGKFFLTNSFKKVQMDIGRDNLHNPMQAMKAKFHPL